MSKKKIAESLPELRNVMRRLSQDLMEEVGNLAKTHKMSPVERVEAERQSKYSEQYDRWKKAEEKWRITPREICQRVRVLRDELESYRAQLEGAPFDIPCGDYETPRSLEHERKYTVTLVEEFNPIVGKLLEMIDSYAKEHGTHEFLDFQSKLFTLKSQSAETGFQIGVLAGVIFAGCPKEVVDRFERGLMFSVESNAWLVKD